MFNGFCSGINLKKQKNISDPSIEVMPVPKSVCIPFCQHQGRPAIPVVKPGDRVKIGTKIGSSNGNLSACIHSSVAGKVIDIKPYTHPTLGKALCCIIETDYSQDWEQELINVDYRSLDKQELLEKIKQAGIVGLGGGGFPTHAKLAAGTEKKMEMLIVNGCESEPNISSDYHIMLEYPACVIEGAKIVQKILNVPRVIFAISKNYEKAAKLLKKEGAEIRVVSNRFPQGAERLLIKRIFRKNVPRNGLPVDIGVIVQNVSTCYAIFQAVKYGKPLIERVITLSGNGINEPKNLLVKIGTPISDVIQFCGGLKNKVKKIILGGVMTGVAQFSLSAPVIKTTNAIVFQDSINNEEERECVRCGKCADVCPMNLVPQTIFETISQKNFDDAIEYGLNECIECGSCAYICPSYIPLVHYFKYAKFRFSNG
ncbi:MAG: electron transport complex subunit RsxC [candidate division WOR-3 bacterium]